MQDTLVCIWSKHTNNLKHYIHTNFLSTDISLLILASFPFINFFGMHFTATSCLVSLCSAKRTFENAPLKCNMLFGLWNVIKNKTVLVKITAD